MNYIWVTKFISNREWKEYYSLDFTYVPIRQAGRGMIVAFLRAGDEVPVGCQIASPEEIKIIREWNERNNIRPLD